MSTKSLVFESFSEYWYFTGCLDKEQRDIIFQSLPQNQQKKIKKSYHNGGKICLYVIKLIIY
jgi:hypothetical protein